MSTYEIILVKKNGIFQINLGEVRAPHKKAAEAFGRKWCDSIRRPQWKRRLSARRVKNLRGEKKELAVVL